MVDIDEVENYKCQIIPTWMDGWPFIPIHVCERAGKELPRSVMLIARFTRVTP